MSDTRAIIEKLKPKRGIVTFISPNDTEGLTGRICSQGHIVLGRDYHSTLVKDVGGEDSDVYLICPECGELEYCSTFGPGDKGYVKEGRKQKNLFFICEDGLVVSGN